MRKHRQRISKMTDVGRVAKRVERAAARALDLGLSPCRDGCVRAATIEHSRNDIPLEEECRQI